MVFDIAYYRKIRDSGTRAAKADALKMLYGILLSEDLEGSEFDCAIFDAIDGVRNRFLLERGVTGNTPGSGPGK